MNYLEKKFGDNEFEYLIIMKKITIIAIFVLAIAHAYAQPVKSKVIQNQTGLVVFDAAQQYSIQNSKEIFKEVFSVPPAASFKIIKQENDKQGLLHQKYQQYYNGVKVEFGTVIFHSKEGKLLTLSDEYYAISAFNTAPILSNEYLFQLAVEHIGAEHYLWEYPDAAKEMDNYRKPEGELVILPVFNNIGNSEKVRTEFRLAYRYDIYATYPISRGDLYIDANTGEPLFYNAIIKHATDIGEELKPIVTVESEIEYCQRIEENNLDAMVSGTAQTRYSGTRTIETRFDIANYILEDVGRKLYTRDALHQAPGTTYPYITNYQQFTDNDNNWTTAEHSANKDDAALDAHWGAMETYDYWLNVHGRDSYDDGGAQIRSYVHVDTNYNNAFWNGSVMSYGDGSCGASEGCNGFDALTAIDVAGHEIGHAVTTYTANLAYQRESGAMNEGFSDIWGASIEHFAKGNGSDTNPAAKIWLIGDEIDRRTGSAAFRSMSNPKSLGQPDTYGGTFWQNPDCGTPTNGNDYCGVHTNSGVLNYWFYLTVVGGTGTNDNGDSFNIAGIGMAKAQAIAYHTLKFYLSANSTYANGRTFAIQAATDLYGACSLETQTVTDAWYAVGVGAPYANTCTPTISFLTLTGNTVEGTDCGYLDITVPLTIAIAASEDADVNFAVSGGTANNGTDYELLTPSVTFPAGTTTAQNMVLRVYSDGFVEGNETAIIDFTVNANGGDATADPAADTYTLTITNDDNAPSTTKTVNLYSEDFEDGVYNVTTSGNTGSDLWKVGNKSAATSPFWTTTGNNSIFAFTNDDACNCNKGNDLLTTTTFSLVGAYSSALLTFNHAFANLGETGQVLISTGGPFTLISTLTNTSIANGGGAYTTPWVNGISLDLSSYIGQANVRIQFKYNDNNTWAYGMGVDDIVVSAVTNTLIQTAVNTGTTNDQINLAEAGTIYTSDAATGNLILDISNNDAHDYGCTDVSVSRSGTGGQAYNGSIYPNLVMDKNFRIIVDNPASPGDSTIKFYFTEAEIAGWEAATNLMRDQLVAFREGVNEISALSIGSFGSNVTLAGTFTGLEGDYIFGPATAFSTCPSSTTYTTSGWTNGAPTSNTLAIINEDYSTATANIEACSLIVNSGKTLTVPAGTYVNVAGNITVNGDLFIDHEGSLVQIDDTASVANNGSITVRKITPFLEPLFFMVLGSPMTAETRTGVYGNAVQVRNHLTANFVPDPAVEAFDPGAENFADDNGDNWQFYSGTINPGEGYLVLPQQSLSGSGIYTLDYTLGTLNNGVVDFNVLYNGTQNASPNIVGNPYASAIDADLFMDDNSMVNALYFWEHLTAATSTYPGYKPNNYDMGDISMYNSSGGLPAANDLGGSTQPNGYISSGQGFGFKATAAGTAHFNNSMRVNDNNDTYRKGQALKERIWLQVSNEDYELRSTTLISFSEECLDTYEAKYDAKRMATPVSLYSKLDSGEELGIQGRSAFNTDQEIPLGFVSQVEENQEFKISISNQDGTVWPDVVVYLLDRHENLKYNLTDSDYIFKSEQGAYNNRFVLLFKSTVLGNTETELQNISLVPNPTTGIVSIISPKININSVEVYDIRGRKLMLQDYKKDQYQLDISALQAAIYFVKINTQQGTLTKRIIKQ